MKIPHWISENILLILTLFLLAFIPLYPKLPLIDVQYTWVYIRIEDFLVALTLGIYCIQLLRKKASLRTPLTIPIIAFWVVGALSTISAIFLLFPSLQEAHPTVAILSYLRRIEYLALFFVAYSAMRKKSFALPVVIVCVITLLFVVFYGLGQKGFIVGQENRFPAYLTMNEEFAKGIPLRLSALARIPSTFAGHYDLAAYLVLLIPVLVAMIFAFKNIYARIFFLFAAISGLSLLLLTASRVSFAVYLFAITVLLLLQKKKILIVPVIVLSILFAQTFQGISQRFSGTISQVDLIVDARTGKAVGIAKEGADMLTIEDIQSTGENLPKGTAYIKLPTSTGSKSSRVVLKRTQIKAGTTSAQITSVEGNFVVQKVLAYDVSFTTRFQGEWPRAIEAFKRNILLGSGYSSINLATDNNYLRILGEVGILGFLSFFAIFLVAGIYIKKVLPSVDSPITKGLILGTTAGVFGLALNAVLIDVFEASKVAFVLWMMMGVNIGLLHLYQKEQIDYVKEIKAALTSTVAIVIYLLLITFGIFAMSFSNFFMGDDFTWLRWASDCKKIIGARHLEQCQSSLVTIQNYFLDANGFFYRPGTKTYFLFAYAIFGLNATVYHIVSVFLHFITSLLTFFISLRVLKNKFFAMLVAFLFIILSVHAESVFWIAATGHIIAATAVLFALLMYMYFKDTRNWFLLVLSIVSTMLGVFFHEFGIVTPLVIIGYDLTVDRWNVIRHAKRYWYYVFYIATIPLYIWLRAIANSHWMSGDYNYSITNLPFNIFGNLLGYMAITFFGSPALSYYEQIRIYGKEHTVIVGIAILILLVVLSLFYVLIFKKLKAKEIEITAFSIGFFVISLLTFLGLGNITTRYAYLPSFGLILLFVYLLQRAYIALAQVNKWLAILFIAVIIGGFSYYQYTQLVRINGDWYRAGQITNNVMKNFNDVFQVAKKTPKNPVFYFVNVPIRTGEAWIFPVGLHDALWFTFQNENLAVNQVPTIDMALDQAEGSGSARVFEFDTYGNVAEVEKAQ